MEETTNTSLKSPGPGTYTPNLDLDQRGRYFFSKFKGSGATVFSPSRSTRFKDSCHEKIPGPGNYSPKLEFSKTGDYFISKFHNSPACTFGQGQKKV